MSWSLEIANGDLAFGTNGMAIVEGGQKLVQDLSCAILEPMGNDPMHPSFGSTIDGSVTSDGNYVPGIIGSNNDAEAEALLESEVTRVATQYQGQQQARYNADVAIYGKSTLTADEVLLNIGSMTATSIGDQLLLAVTLQTGTGTQQMAVPMTSNGS